MDESKLHQLPKSTITRPAGTILNASWLDSFLAIATSRLDTMTSAEPNRTAPKRRLPPCTPTNWGRNRSYVGHWPAHKNMRAYGCGPTEDCSHGYWPRRCAIHASTTIERSTEPLATTELGRSQPAAFHLVRFRTQVNPLQPLHTKEAPPRKHKCH